jgi:hypothetical protein
MIIGLELSDLRPLVYGRTPPTWIHLHVFVPLF